MPLSAIVTNFFYEQNIGISSELGELSPAQASYPNISAELSELLDAIPNIGISTELTGVTPRLLVLRGADQLTGQEKCFVAGDILIRSNDTNYLTTAGVQGITGVAGVIGLPGMQGQTGLFAGATGIRGRTGLTLNEVTGLRGLTGVAGITGIQSVQGTTGAGVTGIAGMLGVQVGGNTGIQGLTGLIGVTGRAPIGVTGLRGATGILGTTGLLGITGISPPGSSPRGETGIAIGDAGTIGITGLAGIGGIETVVSLHSQQSTSSTSLSYTIPGNTLVTNEQQLDVISWGISSTSGVATTVSVTLGGVSLLTQTVSGVAGNPFFVKSLIIRISQSSQENNSYVISRDNSFAERTSTALDLSLPQVLQIAVSAQEGQQLVYGLLVRKVTQS